MVWILISPLNSARNCWMPAQISDKFRSGTGRLMRRNASSEIVSSLTDTLSARVRAARTSGSLSSVPLVSTKVN